MTAVDWLPILIIAAPILVSAIGFVVAIWSYTETRKRYYNDYTKRRGK